MIEYYVGIDNSHSGAIAIITAEGKPVSTMLMPVNKDFNEVDYQCIIDAIHENGGGEHNTRIMLEEPQKYAAGKNAVRIMWSCFHRILVGLECNGMRPDRILSVSWQSKMLEVFGDSKSKLWAEKRVVEIWGRKFLNEYQNKKQREGINDALLIAEFCRRSYLGLAMPNKTCK
jgi:hypothetical protein